MFLHSHCRWHCLTRVFGCALEGFLLLLNFIPNSLLLLLLLLLHCIDAECERIWIGQSAMETVDAAACECAALLPLAAYVQQTSNRNDKIHCICMLQNAVARTTCWAGFLRSPTVLLTTTNQCRLLMVMVVEQFEQQSQSANVSQFACRRCSPSVAVAAIVGGILATSIRKLYAILLIVA